MGIMKIYRIYSKTNEILEILTNRDFKYKIESNFTYFQSNSKFGFSGKRQKIASPLKIVSF